MNILGLIDGLISGQEDEHPEWYDANGKWKGPKIWDLKNWATNDINKFMEVCGPGAKYEGSPPCKGAEEFAASYGKAMDIEKARQKYAHDKKVSDCNAKGKDYSWNEKENRCVRKVKVTFANLTKPNAYYRYAAYCRGANASKDVCKRAKAFWNKANAATHDHLSTGKPTSGHTGASGTGWTWEQLGVKPTPAQCSQYLAHDPKNPQHIIPYTYNTNVPNGKMCNKLYGLTQSQRAELTSYLGPKLDGAGADQGAFNRFYRKYITVDISHYPFTVKIKPSRVSSIVMKNPAFKKLYTQFRHYLVADKTKHVSDWPAFKEHATGRNNVMAEIAYKLLAQALNNGVIYGAPDNTPPSDTIDPNVPSIPQDTTEQAAVPTTYLPYVQATPQQGPPQSHLWLYGGGALVIGLLGVAGYMVLKRRGQNNE